jgi:hypothetical protein
LFGKKNSRRVHCESANWVAVFEGFKINTTKPMSVRGVAHFDPWFVPQQGTRHRVRRLRDIPFSHIAASHRPLTDPREMERFP